MNPSGHQPREDGPSLRPLLKWAGGKRSLQEEIIRTIGHDFARYIEPFLGGGAVLWSLRPISGLVSDVNAELISLYECVRDEPDGLISSLVDIRSELEEIKFQYGRLSDSQINEKLEYFFEIRPRLRSTGESLSSLEPDVKREEVEIEAWGEFYRGVRDWDRDPVRFGLKTRAERAARMIFLNRMGFNGLYRVNSRNQFNVPFGRKRNLNFFDEALIVAISHYLNFETKLEIRCQDFETTVSRAAEGDFIYADPPYAPLNEAKSTFSAYTKEGFHWEDLVRLLDTLDSASDRGASWLLSNVKSESTTELFTGRDYLLREVEVGRPVNSKGSGRGPVTEYLVSPRLHKMARYRR